MSKKIRSIAIYLPQFYPIKINDECWGKGFTEWTNVTKAKPLFKDHYQPHLPADLGFYDLRVPEVRQEQVDLAKQYGIDGFCYYHYWFTGQRVLERPFEEVFKSGKPDFPFMLCWANENWAKVWDGGDQTVMCEQHYSREDHINHINYLKPIFKDERYIKIDGRPVFSIYRSQNIPDIEETIKLWRTELAKDGIDIYINRFESYSEGGENLVKDGFDAAVRFEPFSTRKPKFTKFWLKDTMKNKLNPWYIKYKLSSAEGRKKMFSLRRLDYGAYVDFIKTLPKENNYKLYPGVTPMWDNSARKQKDYFMFTNSTPEKFKEWVEHEIENFEPYSEEENFLFINAWNEWAEGNHMEPCQKWGHSYLKAFKDAVKK
ncbi:glycosyl hydrolase [Formosa sediminum]|uniref:Glycosyl hydrolase n=1 Tax=Formosa sediminum TaxID=2594004 RepID=A0A516GQ74_9FLAO|nr:glycoside hydrolase family 99-like domain-containing protein [Formosa sediminum]QDO93687.1 glycosyl hydrolase [Formosa sediminum]